MTIALLCPTRGRPEQCKRMIESVCRTKSDNSFIDVLTARHYELNDSYDIGNLCDENAPCHKKRVNIRQLQMPDGMPTAFKWNLLAEIAFKNPDTKLFMLCADDTVFSTPHWDKALLDHYNALENKIHVYHLLDSRNENGTPHPIVTREYIEAMGYFLPPLFLHWFVDTWTVEIAKSSGCFSHLKDYMLLHDKPSDRGEGDETHNRIRQMGWHERDKWVHEHSQHFLEFEKRRLMTKFITGVKK